jgi:pimeloyl-ACP methyl ester carboxylesterase
VIAHSFGGSAAGVGLGLHPDLAVNKVVLIGAINAMDRPIRQFGDALDLPRRVVAEIQGTIERRFGRPLDAYRLSSLLCNVDADLMLIHDRQDRMVDYTNALEIHDALPHATFIATEGLGHRRVLADEAILAKIVDFVAC